MKNKKLIPLTRNHEIRTKRLLIRPLKSSDFEKWQKAHLEVSAPLNKFDRTHLPKSKLNRRHFKSMLKRQALARTLDKHIELAVFDRKTGELLGGIIIFILLRLIFKQAMLGYFLLGKNWGKGIAYEANAAGIQYTFKYFDIHRLIALVDKSNSRSNALARRLGMKREGVMSHSVFEHGRWKSSNVWVLINKKN